MQASPDGSHAFSLRRIFSDAAVIIGGSMIANAFNYLYHFLLSRRLGPDDYGTLATLLAGLMILSVFGGAVGVVAMQETAKLWAFRQSAQTGRFVRRMLPAVLGIALIIGALALAASFVAGPYLHIVNLPLWLAFSALLSLGVVTAFFRGAAQGAHRFVLFALSYTSETFVKLCSAVALVAAGMAVFGAIGGALIGVFVGLLVAAIPLAGWAIDGRMSSTVTRPQEAGTTRVQPGVACVEAETTRDEAETTRVEAETTHVELGGRSVQVLAVNACVLLLLFVDQLFAKHHLTGVEAGLYGAAGTIARTIPFGLAMISLVVNPKAAAAFHVSRAALRHLLAIAFGAGALAACAGLAIAALAPVQLLALTYGSKFVAAAGLLRLYALAGALLGVAALGTGYLQSVGSYRITWVLVVAVLIETALMAAWGTSGTRLLTIAIAVNAALLPAVGAAILGTLRTAPQALGRPADEAALVHESRLL